LQPSVDISNDTGGWVEGLSPELQDTSPGDDELPTPTQVEELDEPSHSSAIGPRGSSKTKRWVIKLVQY
jgi:hypothetical protein